MKKTLLILAIAAMAAFIIGCSQPTEGDTAASGTATAGTATAGTATAGTATAGAPAATAGTTG
jgi:hypothetical protein